MTLKVQKSVLDSLPSIYSSNNVIFFAKMLFDIREKRVEQHKYN